MSSSSPRHAAPDEQPDTADRPSTADPASPRAALRSTVRAIAIDALPPLSLFFVLHGLGVPDVIAYTAGSVIPLVRLVVDRWRGRPFNVISALVAVCLVVSVVLALTTGDARAVIARGGVIYLAVAVAAAVSVPTRHPLMLVLARYFVGHARPDAVDRFDAMFRHPHALRAMRQVTVVWALAFTVSALACVACAYTLPVTAAATVTSLLEPIIAMVLAAGTARYMRRAVTALAPDSAAADQG